MSDTQDIDILLDRFANALLLHEGDRHAVDECEHCRTVRERIHALFVRARNEAKEPEKYPPLGKGLGSMYV